MVACYLRNSLNPPIPKETPLKLSSVTMEGYLLCRGIRLRDSRYADDESMPVDNSQRKPPLYYTQDEWVLLCCGTNTRTLKTTVQRNPKIYPSYQEIRRIEGYPIGQRSDNYDYLCIQLPRTWFDGVKERPINTDNPVHLATYYAQALVSTFIDQFDLALGQWELDNKMYCLREYSNNKMLSRRRLDIIYRFFEAYDIPVARDEVELAAVRKKLSRILKMHRRARISGTTFDMSYTDSQEAIIDMQ